MGSRAKTALPTPRVPHSRLLLRRRHPRERRVASQAALQPTGAPPPLLASRQLSRGSESDERRAMEEALGV